MFYEFSGVCSHCAAGVNVLIHNGTPLAKCPDCGEVPFALRKIKGLVYIVSNPNVRGVKIGETEKSMEQRLKGLNNTSVPGTFEVVVVFPSDRPKHDETRIHKKLAKHKISKEHYDIAPLEAVLKAVSALGGKRLPIFSDPVLEEDFNLERERRRIEMTQRLRGRSTGKNA